MNFDDYKTPIFTTVKKSLQEFIDEHGVDMVQVGVIGVSSTGQIDANHGVVVGTAGHVGDYVNVHISDELGAIYGKPVYALNDANAAARRIGMRCYEGLQSWSYARCWYRHRCWYSS